MLGAGPEVVDQETQLDPGTVKAKGGGEDVGR